MKQSLVKLLRDAIAKYPGGLCELERKTGVKQPPLWRFMNQGHGMKVETVDRLAEELGIEFKRAIPHKSGKGRKSGSKSTRR
jgi:hypothetical protein